MKQKYILDKLTTFIFYLSVLVFLIAFNFQDSRNGGWVQQFLPTNIGSAQIKDITFVDSLTGFAVTGFNSSYQCFILKTSNGGDNWVIKYSDSTAPLFQRIQFISKDTGYAIGDDRLYKTLNSGENWNYQIIPNLIYPSDIFILNKDTMWIADGGSFGGLYRTTNGGGSWTQQYSSSQNPDRIYMYNTRIGFMGNNGSLFKTTNSGFNWTQINGEGDYTDIYFVDSLIGYKANSFFKKTTNGGINWQQQSLPSVPGGIYIDYSIKKFSYINDTVYGVWGGIIYPNFHIGSIVFKTTNSGINWGYQIIDTSFHINVLHFTKFIDGKKGWCYSMPSNGIRTLTGGDSTLYTNINQISNIVPGNFQLFQNYPNPYNQCTIINVQLQIGKQIRIDIYDITGKLIKTMINQKESSGLHSYKFDGGNLSSGIYFYTLFVDGNRIDTKKMILIK